MYGAVPTIVPVSVSREWSAVVASPKSPSFAVPPLVSQMFPGFTSRCTTPCSCAYASAPQRSSAMLITRSMACGPAAASSSPRRSPPLMYCETKNGRPSSSPMSYTLTMLGWSSRAIARASRRRRSSSSGSIVASVLIRARTTSRSSAASWTTYTAFCPPSGSTRRAT